MLADDLNSSGSLSIEHIRQAVQNRSAYEALDLFQKMPIHEIRVACLDAIGRRELFEQGRGYSEAVFSLWKDIIIKNLTRCREDKEMDLSQVFIEETKRLISLFIFCDKGWQYSKFGLELETRAVITLMNWYLEEEFPSPSPWEWHCVAKPVLKRLSGIPEILQDRAAVAEKAEKLMVSVIQRLVKKQDRDARFRIYWISDWAMVLQVLKTIRSTKFVSLKPELINLRNKIAEGIIRPAQDDDQLEFDAGHHLVTIDSVLCSLV